MCSAARQNTTCKLTHVERVERDSSVSLHPLLFLQCFVGVVCSRTSGVQMDVLKEALVVHPAGSVNLVRCISSWTKFLGSEELAQIRLC